MIYKIPSYDDIPDAALPAISSAMPAEDALAVYERHQDAQPEVTDRMIEGVADFIEMHLFRERGQISKEAVNAHRIFADRISDALVEFGDDDDDGISVLARTALIDHDDCGYQIHNISRGVILEIARDHYEDFCFEAACWGYLDH